MQSHFCWCCGRTRANERFSDRGHAQHVCKECSSFGREELAFRQAARDIDRLLGWIGVVRRKQRKRFERFLSHADERIRRYASEVAARPEASRAPLDRRGGVRGGRVARPDGAGGQAANTGEKQ